ncbi:MAG TPA: TldD/PmbA family protein [Armatimonadota bacterium]|jgi:TldD protein
MESNIKALALRGVDTAVRLGADYADVRFMRLRRQRISAEDERIADLKDSDDFGFGVRVLVGGAWGFASSGDITAEGMDRTAAEAVEIANAGRALMGAPVTLVPEPARESCFATNVRIDPFAVPIAEKTGLLLDINRGLLSHAGIKKAMAWMMLKQDDRSIATSEGSWLTSSVVTSAAGYWATAVGNNDARSRSYIPVPLTAGWENIDAADLLANTDRVAEQAIEHLSAPDCPQGRFDLVLDPGHIALTIHESVGHPTELDRALGMEESLAGRSFATPEKLGSLQYASPIVNFVADNNLTGGLATQGFDDDGVAAQTWHMIKDGRFVSYGTSREVAGAVGFDRSTGCSRADHWSHTPIVRIPNLSLMPGKDACTPDDLIAGVEDGIYIEGRGSFSIDQMRYNFQFGGDAFWRIQNGKKAGMLKNVTYQSITPEFWNSVDGLSDERFWRKTGIQNCGKGDPGQVAQMTHGAPYVRVRSVAVGAAR